MIGIYNYTVVLTYMSLCSAGLGIFVSLNGFGHPYIGSFFLLFCGLCDAFDGKVARSKKNRTAVEKSFGIQIDSLSDLVAFGILPACIGVAMLRVSPLIPHISSFYSIDLKETALTAVLYAVLLFYILAALIRLAYFNVLETSRQETETTVLKSYTGLPVTSAALIFPAVLLFQFILPFDVTALYFAITLITAFAFLSRITIPKPGLRGILIMVGAGAVEFLLFIIGEYTKYYQGLM